MSRVKMLGISAGMAGVVVVLVGCGPSASYLSTTKALRTLHREVEAAGATGLRRDPVLAESDQVLREAARLARGDAARGAAHYLEAAEQVSPLLGSDAPGTADLAHRYYRHAVGQAAALVARDGLWNQSLAGRERSYRVRIREGAGLLSPGDFDQLTFADAVRAEDVPKEGRREGVGAPMVATRRPSAELRAEQPFAGQAGLDWPVTATAEFPRPGEVEFAIHEVTRTREARVAGRTYGLAADYSLPVTLALNRGGHPLVGLFGLFNPLEFFNEMGLYSHEPLDPARIPVVMIHGLGSDPRTWMVPHYEILAEPELRDRYQVYFFYYPTGMLPMYPAAELRDSLADLHAWLSSRGGRIQADRMILIGHSMGGLLTSTQIRDYRGAWDELFVSPMQALSLNSETRDNLAALLDSSPPRYVQRVVFVATPHRGSNMANSWYGRLAASLLKVPEQIFTLQVPGVARSLTDLGRTILVEADPVNAIHGLQYGNPILRFNESRAVAEWVPYHSIIGDRGKGDTPDSSDGVVAYSSSHLDGARSEKIVPSGHRAHVHPEGVEEIKRILRLHLAN